MEYGHFSACFGLGSAKFAVVHLYEQLMSGSDSLLNEQECPLLTLVDVMLVISTNLVLTSVSFIHNYTNTCTFNTGHCARKLTVEREHTGICNNGLSFNHNYTNKMCCINIYCMFTLTFFFYRHHFSIVIYMYTLYTTSTALQWVILPSTAPHRRYYMNIHTRNGDCTSP